MSLAAPSCKAPDQPTMLDPRAMENYPTVGRLQTDLMLLAHRCGLTRVSTLMWANADSWQYYPWIGVNEEHHALSHSSDDDSASTDKLIKINTWHAEQVGYMLDQLAATPDSEGETMLDNTVLLWGNELGIGNVHSYTDIPWLLAGGAGAVFQDGAVLTTQRSAAQQPAAVDLSCPRPHGPHELWDPRIVHGSIVRADRLSFTLPRRARYEKRVSPQRAGRRQIGQFVELLRSAPATLSLGRCSHRSWRFVMPTPRKLPSLLTVLLMGCLGCGGASDGPASPSRGGGSGASSGMGGASTSAAGASAAASGAAGHVVSSPAAGSGAVSSGTAGKASSAPGSAARGGSEASAAGRGGGSATTGSSTAGLPTGTLTDRIGVTEVMIPAAIKPGVRNWRIWALAMLKVSPIFTVPLANCGTLIGFTTGTSMAPNARAVRLDANDQVAATYDLGALELRGLAAEPDGHFAALSWSDASDQIWVKRYDLTGKELFSTELTNPKNGMLDNTPTDFGLGESRLEFGAGKYGAYYHVHSMSGHEGDTYKFVAADSGMESTTWSWGCSHSMSNLLTFNPTSNVFLASCVTDCYPGTSGSDYATTAIGGVYTENRNKILDVDAGCNGSVAGELGGATAAPTGWKLVFNAHQQTTMLGQMSYDKTTMNQDIGFASIGADKKLSGAVVWLTTTPMVNEADSAIVRFAPMGDSTEQYVVGWFDGSKYTLARVDATGKFLEQPSDVTSKAKWGQRDDPFRAHVNGDIVWSWADAANSTTLKLARLKSGNSAQCASF